MTKLSSQLLFKYCKTSRVDEVEYVNILIVIIYMKNGEGLNILLNFFVLIINIFSIACNSTNIDSRLAISRPEPTTLNRGRRILCTRD